jgi:hypothetical protein
MIITHSANTTEARSLLSSGLGLPGDAFSDETSPLLQTESALKPRHGLSERWHPTASAFLDRNAGLFFIAGSQFFFCLSNVTVKWLNGSDERIPMLEVRCAREWI